MLFVVLNPFSGPGKALQTFQQNIVPIFAEAGIRYQLVVTGNFQLFLAKFNCILLEADALYLYHMLILLKALLYWHIIN